MAHTIDILKIHIPIHTPAPKLSIDQGLQYYRECLMKAAVARWQAEIAQAPAGSDTGGMLISLVQTNKE